MTRMPSLRFGRTGSSRCRGQRPSASFVAVRCFLAKPQPGCPHHDTAVDTGQSRSGGRDCRNDRDAGWRHVALCALGGAGGRQGHRLRLRRARRVHREIFRNGAGSAQARVCGGDDRLARTGTFLAPAGQSAQGPCPEFFGIPDRRGGLRQAGRAAGLSAALFCTGPFDGRRGHAARRAGRHRGVRTLRALRADDRLPGLRVAADARPDAHAARGRNGRAVHSRRQHRPDQVDRLSRKSPDLLPRRYARNVAILEADPTLGIASPTVAWLNAAFAAMGEFRSSEFAGRFVSPS